MHQTHVYLEETILTLFASTGFHLSKPLRTTLVELIVCLLGNNKAHLSKLRGVSLRCQHRCDGIDPTGSTVPVEPEDFTINNREAIDRADATAAGASDGDHPDRGSDRLAATALSHQHPLGGGELQGPCTALVLDGLRETRVPLPGGMEAGAVPRDRCVAADTVACRRRPLHIHVVADREFASPQLAEWLHMTFAVRVTFRLKGSMYLRGEGAEETKVASLIKAMKKGSRHLLCHQVVTRDSTFAMNVLLTWDEKYDEPLVVATTSPDPINVDEVYGQRFTIEPMHKDWKSNAFDLERTRVTDPKRIETLLIPIAFAYVLCVLEGERKERDGEVRVPPKGKPRMVSLFLSGLRAISRCLQRESLTRFKAFIRKLLHPVFQTWNIRPSTIIH